MIQTDGTTSLVQIGNNYFLNTVGSGVNGPELKYNGSPVYAGEFGDWIADRRGPGRPAAMT